MENHIRLTGILNIVYSSIFFCGGLILIIISALFPHIVSYCVKIGVLDPDKIPRELMDIVSIVMASIAAIVLIFAITGITGSIGLLEKREWGRILVLIISFFNLLHVPVGTALGVYSIWTLLNEEAIKLFKPGSIL